MDTDLIHSGLLSIGIIAEKIRKARRLLSSGETETELASMLAQAEIELKVTEGCIAQDLGYQLCPDCWPPELIIWRPQDELICRCCERVFPGGAPAIEQRKIEQFALWREAVGGSFGVCSAPRSPPAHVHLNVMFPSRN